MFQSKRYCAMMAMTTLLTGESQLTQVEPVSVGARGLLSLFTCIQMSTPPLSVLCAQVVAPLDLIVSERLERRNHDEWIRVTGRHRDGLQASNCTTV